MSNLKRLGKAQKAILRKMCEGFWIIITEPHLIEGAAREYSLIKDGEDTLCVRGDLLRSLIARGIFDQCTFSPCIEVRIKEYRLKPELIDEIKKIGA